VTPVAPVLAEGIPALFSPNLVASPYLRSTVWAANQPQYTALPAIVSSGETGRTTTRWSLTWRERWKLLASGTLFIQVLTFGRPLMPVKPMVDEPTAEECL
jgi:hypothetical protein